MGCQLRSGTGQQLNVSSPSYAVMTICRPHIGEADRAEAFDSDGWYLWFLNEDVVARAHAAAPAQYAEMPADFRGDYSEAVFGYARAFLKEAAERQTCIHCSH